MEVRDIPGEGAVYARALNGPMDLAAALGADSEMLADDAGLDTSLLTVPDALLPVLGFLVGVMKGATIGGAVPAILFNTPGTPDAMLTTFDGYPMARQGKAGKALTIAAIASFAGGTIGAILLMVFAPALSSVALLFHSAGYFALMVVGLSAIAAFAGTGQVAKALIMTILGLIMATVGEGALFNLPRFS